MDIIKQFGAYTVRPANDSDNEALAELLKTIHSEGSMPLIEERGQDFFALLRMHMGEYMTFVFETEQEIAGCISYVIRKSWFKKSLIDIAYVCDLRVHSQHRQAIKLTPVLLHTFDVVNYLHNINTCFSSVILTNTLGKNVTQVANADVMSRYSMESIQFVGKPPAAKHKVERAQSNNLDEIANFLESQAKQKVFGYQNDPKSLENRIEAWPNFSIEDIYFIRDKNGEIIATAAPWNSEHLRQTRLLAYHGSMRLLKTIYNIEAKIRNFASLPEAGECFNYASLTHVEIQNNDASLLQSLLSVIYNDLKDTRLHMMSMMLMDNSALLEAFKGFRTRSTKFELHVYQHKTSPYENKQFFTDNPGFEMALH